MIISIFNEILTHFSKPFRSTYFDFSDQSFVAGFAELGTRYARILEERKINSNRGSRHFIYINRTFFGLYNLLHMLAADNIKIASRPE